MVLPVDEPLGPGGRAVLYDGSPSGKQLHSDKPGMWPLELEKTDKSRCNHCLKDLNFIQ